MNTHKTRTQIFLLITLVVMMLILSGCGSAFEFPDSPVLLVDTIDVDDADHWRMSDPLTAGGRFLLSASKLSGGSETLRVSLPRPWQNFLNVGDVNNDGSVTAGDALRIVNELGRHEYSDASTSDLFDP